MARLSVRLLGAFQVDLDDEVLAGFSSTKVRALLAYLVMERERVHAREALAGLLWPDQPQDVAQQNLRQALANLRQVLGDRTASSPLLNVTRDAVGLSEHADCSVDAHEFARRLDLQRVHIHRRREACQTCAEQLAEAIQLYRGEFLAQFYVDEAPEYEAWALLQRERLREDALDALGLLIEHSLLHGEIERAQSLAQRQLALEPWREEAHRQSMRTYALAGNRSAALAQYEACRRILATEFDVSPSPETEAVLRQVRSGRLTPPISLRNWPAAVTSFVGRERELGELREKLENPATRLVTVTGLGGVGKTRLVVEAGARLATNFEDGACYVNLAGVEAPVPMAYAIGAALDFAAAGHKPPGAELTRELQRRKVLLVLDNCDWRQEHRELLSQLLRSCSGLTVVAVTRERLGIDGEWVYQLEGLAPPRAAVELFVARMRQAGGVESLTAEHERAIEEICEQVGGLPLAIELAAAWTPVLSLQQIQAEISRSLRFLDVQPGASAERTLSAIMEQAWQLLPAHVQRVFCQLAVFRDGFRRLEVVAVVDLGADGEPGELPPLDLALRTLVNRSFLRLSPAGRYRQHPIVKQFGEERLARNEDLKAAAEARHSRTYAELLHGAGPALASARQQAVLAELTAEHANLEIAWTRAVAARDISVLAMALPALSTYYDLLGRSRQALDVFRHAANVLQRPEIDPALLGELLAQAGTHAYRVNELAEARDLLEQSLRLLPAGCDPQIALALHGLGNVLFWGGDDRTAETHYADAIAAARRSGDTWRAAALTCVLGDCASVRGDHVDGMARYEEALAVFRELGDPRMIALALANLGDGYRRQGLLSRARKMYEESLEIVPMIGNQRLLANIHNGLGEVAYGAGNLDVATEHFLASQQACNAIASPSLTSLNLVGLAHIACERGDLLRAKMLLREALRQVSEQHSWAVLPVAVAALAHILGLQDARERPRALSLLAQVLCHPTTWEDYRLRAMRLMMMWQVDLPEDVVAHALRTPEPVGLAVHEVLALELPEDAPVEMTTGCMDWGA